jgi:hypothetical protein
MPPWVLDLLLFRHERFIEWLEANGMGLMNMN